MLKSCGLVLLILHVRLGGAFEISTPAKRILCTNGGVCNRTGDSSLNFFLLGDIGGLPIYPYISWAQTTVAKTIAKLGESKNTQFQIALGDNFYFTGVKNVFDHRFEDSFEDVYTGVAMQKPWYIVGGNHDHYGNITAQMAYTNQSNRWTYPSLYYKFAYKFGNPDAPTLAEFIVIDTIILCGNTRDISNSDFIDMLLAPTPDVMVPKDANAARNHWEWLEQQLNQSSADYLFVIGHYPVYSIAEHGPTACLVERLNPLLHKYNVTAYIAGHDHNLQHLVTSSGSVTNPVTVHYIISGAASRVDKSTKNKHEVPFGSLHFNYPESSWWNPMSQLGFTNGAFILGELTPSRATFHYYSGSGNEKYDFNASPRRNQG